MTTNTPSSVVTRADERGSALVMVLLLLMMMSALAAALSVGGQTETFISRNQRSGAQAHAAAEAGLNHAVELATTFIFNWSANGFTSPYLAANGLLGGTDAGGAAVTVPGSLGTRAGIDAAEDIPGGVRLTVGAGTGVSANGSVPEYVAIIMDDDATAPVGAENMDPISDMNRRVIIRATGYATDNSEVILEAILSPSSLGALVVDGDVIVTGSVDISGTNGDVHANGDLEIDGSADISGYATATGTYTGSEPGSGGRPPVNIPPVNPADYKHYADFILTDDGRMTNQAGAVLCATAPCNNWSWDAGSGQWSIGSSAPGNGTYYVEGSVRITGSPGSSSSPVHLSLIAEGSIDIAGSPDITADTPELLFVTGGDLEISGGLDTGDPLTAAGQILVHEQIKFSGNPSLAGQVIVENAPSVSTLVTENDLSGNVDIIYNGNLGGGTYAVTGWREVRP